MTTSSAAQPDFFFFFLSFSFPEDRDRKGGKAVGGDVAFLAQRSCYLRSVHSAPFA